MDELIATRRAQPDDVDAVEKYHHRCFQSTYASELVAGEATAPDRVGMREQFGGWFENGSDVNTQVVDVGGVAVAHFSISDHRLLHLFVEPSRQRQGLGRRLLAKAEAMIASDDHDEFELHVRVDNHAAIAFYLRAGWTQTGRVVRTVEHGISYEEHVLVKRSAQ